MVRISMSPSYKLRPELLLHGTLPEEAFGKAPRITKGQEWWDVERRKAYAKAEGVCMACGELSDNPLHAHETFVNGEWGEIVALCEDCHAFVHIGHTIATRGIAESRRIYRRGAVLLMKAKLVVPEVTRAFYSDIITLRQAYRILNHNYKRRMHEKNKPE